MARGFDGMGTLSRTACKQQSSAVHKADAGAFAQKDFLGGQALPGWGHGSRIKIVCNNQLFDFQSESHQGMLVG